MRKFIKILAGGLATLTALVIIALAILVNLDFNDYRQEIAAQITKATGRPFAINGSLEVDVSLVPVLKATDIVMGNADWSAHPDMMIIDSLMVEVDLLSLISGPPDIHNISISGADILLETAPSGIKNFDFQTPKETNDPATKATITPKEKITKITNKMNDGVDLPILRQIALSDIKVTYLDGKTNEGRALQIEEVTLLGDQADVPMQLSIAAVDDNGVTANLNGVLGSPKAMLDPSELWDVNLIGDIAGVAVDISGAIKDPTTGDGIDLKVLADGDELSNVAKLFLVDIPKIGKFKLDTKIIGSADGDMALTDLALEIGSVDTILIKAAGQLADLNKFSGIDLDIALTSNELGHLSAFSEKVAQKPIPNLGPLNLTTKITGARDRGISLTGINLSFGQESQVKVSAKGAINDAMNLQGVNLDVGIITQEIGNLSNLSEKYAGLTIPALGPLNFKSTLKGGLNTTLAVQAIDMQLGRTNLIKIGASGTIADLYNQTGIALNISAEADAISRVNKILNPYDVGEIPKIGPLSFKGTFTGAANDGLALSDLTLKAGDGKRFLISAKGSVKDITTPKGFAVDVDVKVDNLAKLSELVGENLPALGPLDVQVSILGDRSEKLDITNLVAKIGKSDLSGSFSFDATGPQPKANGSLRASLLRKMDFIKDQSDLKAANNNSSPQSTASTTNNASNNTASDENSGEYIISETPISFDLLKMADGDFDIDVANLEIDGAKLKDVNLVAKLVAGKLTIDNLQFADRGGNPAKMSFTLDASKPKASFIAKVTADRFDAREAFALAKMPDLGSGPLEVDINLTSAGNSAHEIASNLNGEFIFFEQDGLIDSQKLRKLLGADGSVLADVLIGRTGEGMHPVYCMAFDFKITKGMLQTRTALMDTKVSTISATGDVDLATEALGMTVTPHRSVVGLPTTLPILVGGTFKDPRYAPNPVGSVFNLTKSLLGGAVEVITFQGIGKALQGEDSPCINLRPSAREEQQIDQDQLQQDLKKDPEKVIKNLLKGLF